MDEKQFVDVLSLPHLTSNAVVEEMRTRDSEFISQYLLVGIDSAHLRKRHFFCAIKDFIVSETLQKFSTGDKIDYLVQNGTVIIVRESMDIDPKFKVRKWK